MANADGQPAAARVELSAAPLALWSIVAAFGTYFCMYAFRKPFTAAAFADTAAWGLGEKTVLVTAQVLGYTASKFIGIRVIAEAPPERRAAMILTMIGAAEAALLLFGAVPQPLRALCMLANGLSLGMVFGLVLGFLEGRRVTEALIAALCASFILADGVMKSVGTWLLHLGVTERWMPALAGLLFILPLCAFVGMLAKIPPPDGRDLAFRSERHVMNRADRARLVRRHGVGLFLLVAVYFLVTVARSMRADFAPEIWRSLGVEAVPATFTSSETLVAVFVLVANGLSVLIIDNRRAFFTSLLVSLSGGLIMLVSLAGLSQSWFDGFTFMVLMGTGLYLPYVAIQTTVFERLIAMSRDKANLGFLMYVADAAGYLGYAGLMIASGMLPPGRDFLQFFKVTCGMIGVLTCACVISSGAYFATRGVSDERSADLA